VGRVEARAEVVVTFGWGGWQSKNEKRFEKKILAGESNFTLPSPAFGEI